MTALLDPSLTADCGRCAALCCVALPLVRSRDFAFDKPAGVPCRHLDDRFSCRIHAGLAEAGMPGCTVFDCFGAGQRVVQTTYGGRQWRSDPDLAQEQFAVLRVMRAIQEARFLIGWTADLPDMDAWQVELHELDARLETLAGGSPVQLLAADVDAVRREVGRLLREVSRQLRGGGEHLAGADLAGADLRGRDLRRADLRGALLVAADLRGVDLARADLLGADLRDADLGGADLSGALFLSRPQVAAARGDATTALPVGFGRPRHWR